MGLVIPQITIIKIIIIWRLSELTAKLGEEFSCG